MLLIESGPDYPNVEGLPEDLRNVNHASFTDHDWKLEYTPSATSRTLPFTRGRVVGGSSAVNTAIALRGVPEDYDEWAALGNPLWSWERVLPAFIRLESDLDFPDAPYHGNAGPLPIRRHTREELVPFQAAFLDACKELGYPECEDHNDPESTGYGPHPMNKAGSLRISAAMAYLAPARGRPNLTVLPDTDVAPRRVQGRRGLRRRSPDGGRYPDDRGAARRARLRGDPHAGGAYPLRDRPAGGARPAGRRCRERTGGRRTEPDGPPGNRADAVSEGRRRRLGDAGDPDDAPVHRDGQQGPERHAARAADVHAPGGRAHAIGNRGLRRSSRTRAAGWSSTAPRSTRSRASSRTTSRTSGTTRSCAMDSRGR